MLFAFDLKIPRVFHRIWLGNEPLSAEFAAFGETWLAHHRGWELRLWTDANLPDLIRREVFDPRRLGAERADILRYELLWRYGGVYVDIDMECLRSTEPLLEGLDFVTSWHNRSRDRVNNAFIGSVAGHPLLEQAMLEARTGPVGRVSKEASGPVFFDSIVRRFPDAARLDSAYLYPRTTRERAAAYALHHEAKSWLSTDPIERLELNLQATQARLQVMLDRLDTARRELERVRATRWWRARETLNGVARQLARRKGSKGADDVDHDVPVKDISRPRVHVGEAVRATVGGQRAPFPAAARVATLMEWGRAASVAGGGLFAPSAVAVLAAAAFVPWMHGRPGTRVNGVSDELAAFAVLTAAAALVAYFVTRVRALVALSATAGLVAVAVLAATVDDPLAPFGGPGPNIHLEWGIWLALGGSCGVLVASALVFIGTSHGRAVPAPKWALLDVHAQDDPRVLAVAARSPLVSGPAFSSDADLDELRYWEEVDEFGDGVAAAAGFFRKKRVLDYLDYALRRCGVTPCGTVVELGAGSCWASAALACFPDVDRVVAVEFSERRLTEIAPASIALLDAPAEKIERRVADFYAHGLPPSSADLIVMDAAFHHAAEPDRLARVLYDLAGPGGQVLLLREPTLNWLKRTRDHGETDAHGSFEHEYYRSEYVGFLTRAGFAARSVGVRWFHSSGWRRLLYQPPLTLLSGPLRGHYVYLARKPL